MFPTHNPYPSIFSWLCTTNNIPKDKHCEVAAAMRRFVSQAREHFWQPMGKQMPYHDGFFRAAYLLAYFPYYIEPIYHALAAEKLQFADRPEGVMKAAFFGGGPAPEALGLAAYLRDHAPHISAIQGTVFDREQGWGKVHRELLPILAPQYLRKSGRLTLEHKPCDVVNCLGSSCSCDPVLQDTDFVVSQNFLTEIYANRDKAFHTFRTIIEKSRCRVMVFVENAYDDIFRFMGELAAWLHSQGLTRSRAVPATYRIRPRITIPQTLLDNLFIGEELLWPKRNVKFHRMILFIKR